MIFVCFLLHWYCFFIRFDFRADAAFFFRFIDAIRCCWLLAGTVTATPLLLLPLCFRVCYSATLRAFTMFSRHWCYAKILSRHCAGFLRAAFAPDVDISSLLLLPLLLLSALFASASFAGDAYDTYAIIDVVYATMRFSARLSRYAAPRYGARYDIMRARRWTLMNDTSERRISRHE